MSTLQNLEELFVKFQRINRILKDNWNDSRRASYESSCVTPILTEWSQYHSMATDLQRRIDTTKAEIDDDTQEFDRFLDKLYHQPCKLHGCGIYSAHYKDHLGAGTYHFLLDAETVKTIDKDSLIGVAYSKFPGVDEITDASLLEGFYMS